MPSRRSGTARAAPRRQAGGVRSGAADATRMFATVMPGLGRLVGRELAGLERVKVTDRGYDGRSDVVLFEVGRGQQHRLGSLRIVEDVFVEVGRTLRSEGDRANWIAGRMWRPARVEKALSAYASQVRPLAGAMTFRVIARVLQEKSFLRTELRRQLTQAVGNAKPRWRFADPAQIEIWVTEYARGRLVTGIRLSDVTMRQHGGRETERSGALRPTVAALMVGLAGDGGRLLDPCCGSGTILGESLAAGWTAEGRDIDPEAVEASRRNVPAAPVHAGDARELDLPAASVDACVSNLPFGRQYGVPGEMAPWLAEVLAEMARVTRPGGRVVLLVPELPGTSVPPGLRLRDRHPLKLLGTPTTLWILDRL